MSEYIQISETLPKDQIDQELISWLHKIYNTFKFDTEVSHTLPLELNQNANWEWSTVLTEPPKGDIPVMGEAREFKSYFVTICTKGNEDATMREVLGRVICRVSHLETDLKYVTYIHKVDVLDYESSMFPTLESAIIESLSDASQKSLLTQRWDIFRAFVLLKAVIKQLHRESLDVYNIAYLYPYISILYSDFRLLSLCAALDARDSVAYNGNDETLIPVLDGIGISFDFNLPEALEAQILTFDFKVSSFLDTASSVSTRPQFYLVAQNSGDYKAKIVVFCNMIDITLFSGDGVVILTEELPLYVEAVRKWTIKEIGNLPIIWRFFQDKCCVNLKIDLKGSIDHSNLSKSLAEYGFTQRMRLLEFPIV